MENSGKVIFLRACLATRWLLFHGSSGSICPPNNARGAFLHHEQRSQSPFFVLWSYDLLLSRSGSGDRDPFMLGARLFVVTFFYVVDLVM
jgi:hypothetical protein